MSVCAVLACCFSFLPDILAIVDHLCTSPRSRLTQNRPFPKYSPPIYFSVLGRFFFLIPAEKYRTVIMGICALSNYFITTIGRADKHFGALPCALLSLLFTVVSLVAALVSSNVVAVIMSYVLHKPLSWFTNEHIAILLYGPPAITASLAVQYLFSKLVRGERRAYLERASLDGLGLFFVLTLLLLTAFGIGSSYLAALGSVCITLTVAINDLLLVGFERIDDKRVAGHERVHPWAYLVLSTVPATIGVEGLVSFLDLFVPLTGRTGEVSPADHIVGSIVAVLSFLCLPFTLPLAHRLGPKRLLRVLAVGTAFTVAAVAVFSSAALKPFDAAHPKRLFVHAVQNVTSDTFWLNIGGADPDVAGLDQIAKDVHLHMGIPSEPYTKVHMDEYNPDFAILYPVSNFITPYKMRLQTPARPSPWTLATHHDQTPVPQTQTFVPRVTQDKYDWDAGTRQLTLTLDRPNLIWSVMAFDADILEWDLPTPPPKGMQRHHLKEVARYGQDQWSIRLLLRLPQEAIAKHKQTSTAESLSKLLSSSASNPIRLQDGVPERDPSKLWIDYSALVAEAMWPQAARLDPSRRAMYPSIDVLESLDSVLQMTHPEVDSMLLSVVAAVAQV